MRRQYVECGMHAVSSAMRARCSSLFTHGNMDMAAAEENDIVRMARNAFKVKQA